MPAGLTRFTSSARHVLSKAHQEAVQLNHTRVGPGHILIGLIQEEGEAGKVLAGQDASLDAVRKIVIEQTPDAEKAGPHPGRIDLQDTTQKLLEQAVQLSRQYQSGVIGSVHILLALAELNDQRTQTILKRAGLDREGIRLQVRQYLAEHPIPDEDKDMPVAEELKDLLDTLHKLRHLPVAELTSEDDRRLNRIESILREYFTR